MEQDKQEESNEAVKQLLKEHIANNYEPAVDFRSAEMRLTTEQILDRVHNHFQGAIDSNQITAILTELGFKFDSVELNFYWLLNPK